MDKASYTIIDTKIGKLGLVATRLGLARLDFSPGAGYEDELRKHFDVKRDDRNALLKEAKAQLEAFLEGKLKKFDIALDMRGTEFQKKTWNALLTIPYGEVVSYAFIARKIGHPNAARAVGMANHANPLPIVVPCHRVIGKDGSLTGYGGGLKIKKALLAIEGK